MVLIVLLVAIGVYAFTRSEERAAVTAEPATFEECAALYPVMESMPRQCATPSGTVFAEGGTAPEAPAPAPTTPTGGNTTGGGSNGIANLITVDNPSNGERISSPLVVTGEARGPWYFEASFPIELRNSAGVIIYQGGAQAQGEWMTENFVPFRATLTFPAQPAGSKGTLILRKDNPSGLPERDQSVSIPVTF